MKALHILPPEGIASHVACQIVSIIRDVLRSQSYCVFVPSAGRTFVNTFAELTANHADALDWKRVTCFQMDEYQGISNNDSRSFAFQIYSQFAEPLGIGRFQTFFDEQGSFTLSLDEYEQRLNDLGGIDCVVHGVGRNAHIGFNEPSDVLPDQNTRVIELSPSTRHSNNVSFGHGVTLGLDVLTSSKSSIVVLTGIEKQFAAESLLIRPQGPNNPVGYLRDCSNLHIFIDDLAVSDNLGKRIQSNQLYDDINRST